MKLINHSNSIYKVNRKRIWKPRMIIKTIIAFIIVFLFAGVVYENVSYSNDIEALKTSSKYTTINGKKIHYSYKGGGEHTVVMDSDTGYTMYEWQKVIDTMPSHIKVNTFIYDRAGFGESDKGEYENPEAQARKLHLMFRKLNLQAPYILVGDGYGSLVMTTFAKLYPEEVAGMVLVNPINEKYLDSSEYVKAIKDGSISRNLQKVGSYIGLNRIMDKLGLISYPEGLIENLEDIYAEDIIAHRFSKDYNTAVINEMEVLINRDSSSQSEGMLGDTPLAIIVNKDKHHFGQLELKTLTNSQKIEIHEIDVKGDVIPLENPKSIHDAIQKIINIIELEN
ncbi:alpha/beta fold hydrolase [Alloiococcus sp. CFN-8]|uniref:alpha/beta fold hydrolase n=1 Tax=Alloiococcus sp. CFN-8 TaxID=3416081 RepID=UPI003CED7AA2